MTHPGNTKTRILLVLPLVVVLLAASFYGFANYQARSLVDSKMADMVNTGVYQSLAYDDFSLSIDGSMHMTGLQIRDAAGIEYEISQIDIPEFDYFNDNPQYLSISATGIRFPDGIPDFGNTGNSALNDYLDIVMDADSLPLQFDYRHNYTPEQGQQLDSAFSILLPESFSLSTASVMRHVSLDEVSNITGAMSLNPLQNAGLMKGDIPSASITLEDLGLIDAMMAVQGESFGMDSDEYRQQLLAQIQTMVLFAPQQLQSLAQEVTAAVVEFLEGGKSLRLSMNPEYDGNIQRLQGDLIGAFYTGNFEGMVKLLHLEIETF